MIYIKQVKIQDFKNISAEQTFVFDKNINVLVGKNGCGKTTILDAITWCLVGRLYNGAVQGWKPKNLYIDEDNNVLSKVKDLFNTLVEVTISFDDGQKDIIVKRTSCCGKSTIVYLDGITDTQKMINAHLENRLSFDLSKLLILVNPEILFNPDEVSQAECGKLIYDSVYKKVQDDLKQLYDHLFDEYDQMLSFLQDNTMDKTIGTRLKKTIKNRLDAKESENDVLESLQEKISTNSDILATKSETIKSQELILQDYQTKLKQELAFKKISEDLDKAEQVLRQKLFTKQQLVDELQKLTTSKNTLVVWLNDFEELQKTNPSNHQIKVAFGLAKQDSNITDSKKINVLSKSEQKVKCPVCGNWYIPKPEPKKEGILDNLKQISDNKSKPQQEEEIFNYLPKLNEIKHQIEDLKNNIDTILDKISAIDKEINLLEYKDINELQQERNRVSQFFASLEQGKNIFKQVEAMKATCDECTITNKFLNILVETMKTYIKARLNIIMKKLNQSLASGKITLFKIMQNGTIKENVTIMDSESFATYAETNQSKRIRLGIEVCKLLQDFNGINFPIFIDEIGRFNNYDFINQLGHQIIATKPTNNETIVIEH